MCGASPFCLVAELVLQVWPDIFNSNELGFECFIRRANDVVLLFERNQHFLDLKRGLSEKMAARQVGWVENEVPVRFIDRMHTLCTVIQGIAR